MGTKLRASQTKEWNPGSATNLTEWHGQFHSTSLSLSSSEDDKETQKDTRVIGENIYPAEQEGCDVRSPVNISYNCHMCTHVSTVTGGTWEDGPEGWRGVENFQWPSDASAVVTL